MSIFTKLKTATDFSASVIKEGFALIWPEKKSDGSVALQVKLEDGSVQEIGGGSAGDIDDAVRIYDATVESSTGVVTITDGTPVTDLRIGDEIRTPDGVYQKTKDSTTSGDDPATGDIKVSGITMATFANGVYKYQSENKWKHESADYYMVLFDNTYWVCGQLENPSSYTDGYVWSDQMTELVMPWEVENWTTAGPPSTVVVESLAEQTVTNTIDLFEYATFPEDGAKISDITDDIAMHNQNPSAHPDKLPLSGGQMTGGLKINTTDALRINNGDYGVFLRKDASSFYIMVTAQGDPDGTYTDARPLKIDLATGVCSINGGATTDSLGNVITTTYAQLNHPAFSNGVEILGATPYIDFHYNNSESDYTFRIVQNSEDTLTLGGKVNVTNNLTVASGGMSVAGGIKNTGEIQSETSNSYRIVSGNYGTFWRNDGRDLYLMLTNSGDQYGLYNDFRPLTVDLATGVCTISGSALKTEANLSSTGVYPTVSMNTTATADFNTFKTQGNYWFALGIRPNGPLGDSASTTGVLSVYNIQNVHTLQVYNMYSATGVNTQQMYYRWCYSGTWTSWLRLSPSPIMLSNPDYNQVTQTGTYYMSTGSGGQNAPDRSSYMLTVLSYKEKSWERIFQTAVRYVTTTRSDKQAIFIRIGDRTTEGGEITWTDWSPIASSASIGSTGNDYNTLTEPGDYYLSFGQNTSNVNAPANGPFHVLVHRYQNEAGTAKPILQIAASQVVDEAQTPMMFFRSAAYSNSAWTFQPWLRLLTEKDVTYNTGIAGGSLTKNDYIKIGNVIIYIGSVNLRLNSGTTFALPVLSNNMTFVASCNTYVSTITMLDIYLDSNNRLNIDIRGTRSESATDDQVNVGWIGIGYLN